MTIKAVRSGESRSDFLQCRRCPYIVSKPLVALPTVTALSRIARETMAAIEGGLPRGGVNELVSVFCSVAAQTPGLCDRPSPSTSKGR
jgi:hypothetical protein